MKRKAMRILSVLLTVVMLINTCLPVSAFTGATQEGIDSSIKNGYSDSDTAYEIYPTPQDVVYVGGENPTTFTLTKEVNVVYGNTVDEPTKKFVEEILANYNIAYTIGSAKVEGKSNLLIGVQGQVDTVNTYATQNITLSNKDLFNQTDAYLISAKDGTIVILGRHVDAAFYGVATLQMMFSSFAGSKFLNAQIEDYSVMENRGFIEGFYGSWDNVGRASLMRMGRDFKMTSYVYASKADTYHTSKCTELYPADQLEEIRKLVVIGEETKCRYVWSCHLTGFFGGLNTNDEAAFEAKFQKLLAKFQQLYDVGVRRFDILNDDFGGGSHADVVRVLNRLDDEFIKRKGCAKINYCPQGYNEAWSGNGAELEALKSLNDTINIYWTGRDVNSPITQSTVDFLTTKSNHKPVMWVNYPCNEHARSGLFLGNITHYAQDNVTGCNGIISNGSQWAEANKVGFAQMACLSWNNKNFSANANELWENILKYIQPEVYDSFLTLARNITNCPKSGRIGQGFPESEYIKDKLEAITAKVKAGQEISNDQNALDLIEEFTNIQNAIVEFEADCLNKNLVNEMKPWMESLNDLAVASSHAIAAYNATIKGDTSLAWTDLSKAILAYETQDKHMARYVESATNSYDRPALAGSKRIEPFAKALINVVKEKLTPILNPVPNPTFIGRFSGADVSASAQSAKMFDKDYTTSATYNTVQKVGDYYGIDYGVPITIKNVDILQGASDTDNDIFHNCVLETSLDGKTWTTVKSYTNSRRISESDLNIEARFVRLRLVGEGFNGKPDYWTHIREFEVNKYEIGNSGVFSNIDGVKGRYVNDDDLIHELKDVNEITLAAGKYIGIKLPEILEIQSIKAVLNHAPANMELEYSENGSSWKTVTGGKENVRARFVRIHNNGSTSATVTLEKFQISVVKKGFTPKFLETNYGNLKEGSWENVLDKDPTTFAWTNESQKTGDYITFDLGNTEPLYDVRVTCADGNPRFYNAQMQVSTDNKTWKTLATVVNGTVAESEGLEWQVPYWYINGNNNGELARYVRMYVTAPNTGNYYIKMNELEVNRTVQMESAIISTNISGDVSKMFDNNLATMYLAEEALTEEKFVEYKLTEKAALTKISILQDSEQISNAKVEIKVNEGASAVFKQIGTLDTSANVYDLKGDQVVQSVKVTWPKGSTPSIYEIYAIGKDLVQATQVSPVDKVVLNERIATATAIEKGENSDASYNALQAAITVANGVKSDTKSTSLAIIAAISKLDSAIAGLEDGGSNPNPEPDPEVPAPENPEDVARKAGVTVEFTGTSRESGISDPSVLIKGTTTERFATDYVAKGNTNAGVTSGFIVNLGKAYVVTGGKIAFHNLAYSTDTTIEVSKDKVAWATMKNITKPSGGAANPVDEYTFAKPVIAQYVKVTFKGMNTAAGANYVIAKYMQVMGGEVPAQTVDKTALQAKVTQADKKVESNYTAASWGPFKSALAAAKVVLGNANATKVQVEGALATLTTAMNNLVEKPVIVEVTSVTLNKTTTTLKVGETEALTATVNPSNATNKTVTYASSDTAVATVSNVGLVTAKKAGSTVITATAGSKSATCTVTVKPETQPEVVDKTALQAKVTQADKKIESTYTADSWSPFKSALAAAKVVLGNVDATKAQVEDALATLTTAMNNLVEKPVIVEVTSVTLNKTTASLKVGETETLTATVNPSNATNKAVTYVSSDTAVATVSNVGLVTAKKAGSTVITATAGSKSATCTVTVKSETQPEVKNGWVKENNTLRYYENNKPVANKWVKAIDKTWRYAGKDGWMAKGWLKDGNTWYYLGNEGIMKTGWQQVNRVWYLLSNSGKMQTGWKTVNGSWYLLASNGMMKTGWQKVGTTWYYLNASGKMQTGWFKDKGVWYYLKSSGGMATGWLKDAGKWYYMSTSGKMQTGWIYVKGTWYYLKANGVMATGWTKVGNKLYYLNSGTGAWNGQVK